MDIADRCVILPNERINPHFGRAARGIESSESRKIAPLIKGRPLPNPPHEPIIQRSENMRRRASKFWPLAQVQPHDAANGASEPGAPNPALYSQHQRFKFASSQPRASVDTVDDQTFL